MIQKLLRALAIMSAATDNKEFLASDEIGPIALGAALRSWRRQVHIHFAYYKFLQTNSVCGMKEDGLMQMLLSEDLDSRKLSGLEIVRGVPLCGMDRIKRHILIHPSCPLSALMDKKNNGPMVIMVNQEWHCSHQVAVADLEDSGLLSSHSQQLSVADAFAAPSSRHDILGGTPQVLAYRKRARSELCDSNLLELKRLRIHMDHFQ